MDEYIRVLKSRLQKVGQQYSDLQDALHAAQKVCEHEFILDHHDSHHSWSTCKHCGLEEKDV